MTFQYRLIDQGSYTDCAVLTLRNDRVGTEVTGYEFALLQMVFNAYKY